MEKRELLIYLHIKYKGDWVMIFNHLKNKVPLDKAEIETLLEDVDTDNYITMVDNEYPDNLKLEAFPPFVITKEKTYVA